MTTAGTVCWGVVGPGWVARDFFMPAVEASPRSQVVACLGSSPTRSREFATAFGLPHACSSLDELLATPGLDAVYVALPNALHHDAVLRIAAAGKHVLCEKPMALAVDHAVAMVETCERAGVVLRVAHQIRLDEAVGQVRALVAEGRLGRLASIHVERASGLAERQPWRTDVSQSGVIFDVGVHLLDLVRWLTGQAFREVAAFTHPDRREGRPDDTVSVLARLDGECHATVRASREVASAENNIIIQGSDATLVTSALRFASEHVVRLRDAGGAVQEMRYPASPAYAREVRAFEDAIDGKPCDLPDGRDALATVRATVAVLQSIQTRGVVAVQAAA